VPLQSPTPNAATGGALAPAPLVVERREDARRERRRTAALDQPGQRVQVHTGLARQCLRDCRVEARVTKARAAPGDYVGRFLPGPSLLSGCKVHVLLAQREWALLRREFKRPRCWTLASSSTAAA
jgi:hypothetical protein